MRPFARVKQVYGSLGRVEKIFLALLVAWSLWPDSLPAARPFVTLLAFFIGSWVAVKWTRRGLQQAIWRLRNRLYVSYLFIAVVPVALLVVLAGLAARMYTSQVAVYLVTSELERRTNSLKSAAQWIARTAAKERDGAIRQMMPYLRERYPGLQILVENEAPARKWGEAGGLLLKDGLLHAWARQVNDAYTVTMLAPLTMDYLSELVPRLGAVEVLDAGTPAAREGDKRLRAPLDRGRKERRDYLPPPANRFDLEVWWFSRMPAAQWEHPGELQNIVLAVRSRFSAVFNVIASQRANMEESLLPGIFLGVTILLLIVEFVSLVIGVSLSRTITGAVEELYEGTRRVQEGDFKHRIAVSGGDQLAELGRSFNSMTENLDRLLAVAKEKERLQSELEIAREVQHQLYPRGAPELKTLRLMARCNPARMVSGDYYDYQTLGGTSVALAIGDVAGKGISAALLMATVESSVRTQIWACLEAQGDGTARHLLSTSRLVAQLNQQLYAHTSPEKYATFYFGVYDDATGVLTYTNAGHLPPILLRNGKPQTLDVNGMVVGAFPFAEYQESRVQLECGDLLVCYTDGVTEPENEYGEMFGEQRLIDVLMKNAGRDTDEILSAVTEAVTEWTGSGELQDDMTLLLARRHA